VFAWPAPGITQPASPCVQSGIAGGGDHTCVFTTPGSAMCWGDNSFGQNGNGTLVSPTRAPTVVIPSFPGQFYQLVAGSGHTCAVLLPGLTAVCWGDDSFGQLGDDRSGNNTNTAVEVPVMDPNNGQPLRSVNTIAAGSQHSCALICPP